MKFVSKLINAVLVVFVFSFNIKASVNIRLSLEKLVNMSTHIVVGKVIKISSKWNEDHSRIITDMKFEIIQKVSGKINSEIIAISLPGGSVDGISTIIVDGATFKEGEKALLFLREIPPENTVRLPQYRLADLTQGKYKILKENGKEIAVSETIGRVKLIEDENGFSLPPGGETGIEVGSFITNIKAKLKP